MRLKDGFKLTDVAGDYMLIPVGEHSDSFGGFIALNECSAFLVKQLSTEISFSELVSRLLKEYAVDEATAVESVKYTVDSFSELGVIEGDIR